MARERILIVEDEIVTRRLLERTLETEGYAVSSAAGFEEASAMTDRGEHDLILLDVVLPTGDGLTLCRRIRARHRTPIVMLTSKSDATDIVAALEIGADDYVVKPFDLRVLLARIRSHLRRAREAGEAAGDERPVAVGDLVVDPFIRDATRGGRPVGLTPKEFELLSLLATRAGRAVSRDTIEHELFEGESRSEKILAVYVRKLREKIEPDPTTPRYLFTVRGYGYRLGGPPDAVVG